MGELSLSQRIAIIIELLGGPKFAADTRAAKTEMRGLGAATATAGREMSSASRRTWSMNQALFTMRRYAFYATLAITAVGAGALKWGYNYYTTITQANIAFKQLLGSASAAQAYVQRLYRVAAETPFSFEEVTNAAKRFISLGQLDPNTAVRTINDMADAMAAFGAVSSSQLSRANIQLSTMLGLGRLTGQVALNLVRDHIPIYQALASYYNASIAQVKQGITAGVVDSKTALEALHQYVQSHFGGQARKQTFGTIPLLFTTFRDYVSKLMYIFEQPVLEKLRTRLESVTKTIDRANTVSDKLGGSWKAALVYLDRAAHTHGVLANQVSFLLSALRAGWAIFVAILKDVGIVLWALKPVFTVTTALLNQMAKHTTILQLVLLPLVAAWIVWHGLLLTVGVPIKILTASINILTGAKIREALATTLASNAEKRGVASKILAFLWTNKLKSATILWTRALASSEVINSIEGTITRQYRYNTAMDRFVRLIRLRVIPALISYVSVIKTRVLGALAALTAAVWVDNVAWYANPLTWIVVGVGLLAALTVLYFKWKKFHDIVNQTFSFIKRNQWWLQLIPIIAPFVQLINLLNKIYSVVRAIVQTVQHPLNWKNWLNITEAVPGLPTQSEVKKARKKHEEPWWGPLLQPLGPIFGGQHGGRVPYASPVLTGERGPELLFLPGGSMIKPLPDTQPIGITSTTGGNNGQPIQVNVQLRVDRRVLAEAVAHARADVQARA